MIKQTARPANPIATIADTRHITSVNQFFHIQRIPGNISNEDGSHEKQTAIQLIVKHPSEIS